MRERSSANRFTGLCFQEPKRTLEVISFSHWITIENPSKKGQLSGRPFVDLIRLSSGLKTFCVRP
jgi:hypothetical protein